MLYVKDSTDYNGTQYLAFEDEAAYNVFLTMCEKYNYADGQYKEELTVSDCSDYIKTELEDRIVTVKDLQDLENDLVGDKNFEFELWVSFNSEIDENSF